MFGMCTDGTGFKPPLSRCGEECGEFEAFLIKHAAPSGGLQTDFRHLKRLKDTDDNVGFENMLAGHRSTISIALGDATFRTAAFTANFMKEYKRMIANARSHLEENFQKLCSRLQAFCFQEAGVLDEDETTQEVPDETDIEKQCPGICVQVSKQIDQVPTNILEDVSTAQDAHQVVVATLGDVVWAKRISAGPGATQWLGQMSDATIQQLSRDRQMKFSGRAVLERVLVES